MTTLLPVTPRQRPFRPALALAGLLAALAPAAAETQAQAPAAQAAETAPMLLAAPVGCTLGVDCWVQNLVDVEEGTAVGDFRCTRFTYDGHSGTDFRIANRPRMDEGVAVLAAAPGQVLRTRDGEPDRSFDEATPDVSGRECGNGVVIGHANGYETQYCHLRAGSIVVAPGDRVEAGTPIGLVGASGETAFFHVHFTVRQDGRTLDPFTGRAVGEGVCGVAGDPLWKHPEPIEAAIEARVIGVGFATDAVAMADIEEGRVPVAGLDDDAPALVFFGRAANLRAGDEQRIVITGPGGLSLSNTADPLPARRAQAMVFAGRRAPEGGFPAGIYAGRYEVLRDGEILDTASATITLER